jgi:hypothetical protein
MKFPFLSWISCQTNTNANKLLLYTQQISMRKHFLFCVFSTIEVVWRTNGENAGGFFFLFSTSKKRIFRLFYFHSQTGGSFIWVNGKVTEDKFCLFFVSNFFYGCIKKSFKISIQNMWLNWNDISDTKTPRKYKRRISWLVDDVKVNAKSFGEPRRPKTREKCLVKSNKKNLW